MSQELAPGLMRKLLIRSGFLRANGYRQWLLNDLRTGSVPRKLAAADTLLFAIALFGLFLVGYVGSGTSLYRPATIIPLALVSAIVLLPLMFPRLGHTARLNRVASKNAISLAAPAG
jgi:hypothetical protein